MDFVYLVWHTHVINEDENDDKMIGVYSTQEFAEEAVERSKELSGFCDVPEGFHISKYELNKDHWTEGYITVFPNKSAFRKE